MRNHSAKLLAALLMFGVSSTAFAHPGHNVSGLTAGLLHPFTGLDHLLAMVAVGLWAAQCGGRRVWLLPATFMMSLACGAAIAMQWQGLPLVEAGIAVSVLAFGLILGLAARLGAVASIAITAVFGLLHGYAHGLELPQSAMPAAYALGFLTATAVLHLCGIVTGIAFGKRHAGLVKAAGAVIAVSGAYLLSAV